MNSTLSADAKKILLRIISLVMLMEMLDTTVLNTALPQIARSLHTNPLHLKETLTIYFLSLGIFIPVSGWVADRYGEKKSLLAAILLFTSSSMACGLAVNLPLLILFRFFQGMGGAFLMPVGRQILVRVFPGIERMRAMAAINIMMLLGLSLGPLIGGALTTYANWRWIFFINVFVGLPAIFFIYHYLPVIRQRENIQFDWMGFMFIALFLGTALFLLDIVVEPTIGIDLKLGLLALSFCGFFLYIRHAKKVPAPLIRLDLFRQSNYGSAAAGSFLSRLTLATHPFLVPLLLQAGYGYTAMTAGLFTIPAILSTMGCMFFISHFVKRFDRKKLLMINTILLFISFASFHWQAVHLMIPLLIVQQCAMGFLSPLQTALMNNQAYDSLHGLYVSQGTSFYSVIIQVSGSFGIALAALAMIAVIGQSDLQHTVPLVAFRVVFLVQSIYLLFALWIFKREA